MRPHKWRVRCSHGTTSAHPSGRVWSPRDQEWRDVTDEPFADIAAELRAEREYLQEQERERSRRAGFPPWQVRVNVPSHRDVVALAGHPAAQGWRVRRRRRHLLVGADCEDDAKGLVRELSGDGRADADAAFRVRRVSYSLSRPSATMTSATASCAGPRFRPASRPRPATRCTRRCTNPVAPSEPVTGWRRADAAAAGTPKHTPPDAT
jgi:hypothetical protein